MFSECLEIRGKTTHFCIPNFSFLIILFEKYIKHNLKVRQKYSATRRIFNSLLSVSSGDETLRLMLDILRIHEKTWRFKNFHKKFVKRLVIVYVKA